MRAEPCRDSPGLAVGQLPVDAVGRDHRIIHQHAEGNDQGGNGDLVEWNPGELHASESHRDRQGDGHGDDEGGAPFHEEQGHRNHEEDGLHETQGKVIDPLGDGFGLVRDGDDLHALRELRAELVDRRLHLQRKVPDPMSWLHLHGQHHRTAAACSLPAAQPFGVQWQRRFVAALHVKKFAEALRFPFLPLTDDGF